MNKDEDKMDNVEKNENILAFIHEKDCKIATLEARLKIAEKEFSFPMPRQTVTVEDAREFYEKALAVLNLAPASTGEFAKALHNLSGCLTLLKEKGIQ